MYPLSATKSPATGFVSSTGSEIDRPARPPNEIKASVGKSSRKGWLRQLVRRPAAV